MSLMSPDQENALDNICRERNGISFSELMLEMEDNGVSDSYFKCGPVEIPSLEKLTLKCIVKNFERIYPAYEASENPTVKKGFLELKYTDELVQDLELVQKFAHLNEKFLEFFLNKHTRVLNICYFENCGMKTVADRLKKIGEGIKEVIFSSSFLSSSFVHRILQCIPNVEVVYFNDKNDGIYELSTDFPATPLSNKTLKIIATCCTKIKEFNIDFRYKNTCPFSENGIKNFLDKVPHLTVFNYNHLVDELYDIYRCLDGTESRYKLTSLDLLYYGPYDIVKTVESCAKMCPELQSISLPALTFEHATLFCHFPNIQKVKIVCLEWGVIFDALKINGIRNLKNLDITLSHVLLKNLSEACPFLESMRLCTVMMSALTGIAPFTKLKDLAIESADYSNLPDENNPFQLNALLQSCPVLESLAISRCNLHYNMENIDIFIESLPSTHLKHVKFEEVNIQIKHLTELAYKCQHLEFLSVKECYRISVYHARILMPLFLNSQTHFEISKVEDEEIKESVDIQPLSKALFFSWSSSYFPDNDFDSDSDF